MNLHWSSRFVGLPWADKGRTRAGVDCYGLVYLAYRDALGITLPSYVGDYAGAAEREEIAALMSGGASQWPWSMSPPCREQECDVALFRRAGIAVHVGIVLADGRMLHIEEGGESCIVQYTGGRWLPRLVGVYRHAGF